MNRYMIDSKGNYHEDPEGIWVTYDDCIDHRKEYVKFKDTLKQISELEWYEIDSGPDMAKEVLKNV